MSIYKEIAVHAQKLEHHPLMEYFRNTETATAQSFNFVPSMAFFVLGFKDILAATYNEKPTTPLEENLNTHCIEDAEHWRWFLEDLAVLDELRFFKGKTNINSLNMLADIWSTKGFVVRKHTCYIFSLLSEEKCPENKLIIIECLEAAFSVFISNLTLMTKRSGLYETLRYFGQEHHYDESQHAMGSWLNDHNRDEMVDLHGQDDLMSSVVAQLFIAFHEMFDVWSSDINEPSIESDHIESREEVFA